jgi:hypothetical protein
MGAVDPVSAFLRWLREWSSRLIAGLALATVATVAGVVSYTHIDALTLALGGSRMVGHLMPFGVDGQIVVGSVVLLTATGRAARWGWLGIGPGMAESLFANYMSGASHGRLAAGWAMVPALSFAVATFMLERWLKSQFGQGGHPGQPKALASDSGGAVADASACPHQLPSTADEALVTAFLHSRDCTGRPLSQRALSEQFGQTRHQVAALVGPHVTGAPEGTLNGVGARG